MGSRSFIFKPIAAALALAVWISAPQPLFAQANGAEGSPQSALRVPVQTDPVRLDDLFAQLVAAESPEAGVRILNAIRAEWSKSGSAAIDLLVERGLDAIDKGDYPQAVEHLTAALDHAPDYALAYQLRATAYYMTGHIGPALDDLGHSLILEPRQIVALQGLAVLLEEMGKPEEALVVFRAVLAIHPTATDIVSAVERLEQSLEGQVL